MAWKQEYEDNRRAKMAADPEYRERIKSSRSRSPEENREYMREYHAANRSELAAKRKVYRQRPEVRERRNRLRRERYANDPEWRERHKASVRANPAAKREAKLRRLYGISSAEFDAMLVGQGG